GDERIEVVAEGKGLEGARAGGVRVRSDGDRTDFTRGAGPARADPGEGAARPATPRVRGPELTEGKLREPSAQSSVTSRVGLDARCLGVYRAEARGRDRELDRRPERAA